MFELADFTEDRPFDRRLRQSRSHNALAIGPNAVRCGRCGNVRTNVETIIGPSYYLPEHDDEVKRLVRQAWDDHLTHWDKWDNQADRDAVAADVTATLTRLRDADPDPTVAAIMLLTGLTRDEIDEVGTVPV